MLQVINRIGLIEGARVEARGFSGSIRCLWKSNFIAINVVSTSRYCIHLKMNQSSPYFWYFSVIYASPIASNREEVWQELKEFHSLYPGPWCITEDFNTVIFASEREGSAAFYPRSSNAFVECIEDCNLMDMGFARPSFTWVRGQLRERLDGVLCNSE